jgi:hypothetical protein
MNHLRILGIPGFLLLAMAAVALAPLSASSHSAVPRKKCDCYEGGANCFFDGSRCPANNNKKCNCAKPDVQRGAGHECCCTHEESNAAASISPAAAEFCESRCPKKVGGETCGAQCRLKKGHAGKHLCLKLHDF